jgi:hypothetical protein
MMFDIAAQPKELMLLEGVPHIGSIASAHAVQYKERIREFIGSCRT